MTIAIASAPLPTPPPRRLVCEGCGVLCGPDEALRTGDGPIGVCGSCYPAGLRIAPGPSGVTAVIALHGRRARKGGLVAILDEDDAARLGHLHWTIDSGGYAQTSTGMPTTRMHRLVLPGVAQIDHINGDKLDNRRANLRPATTSQNMHAADKAVGRSGYRGVWRTVYGRWQANLTVGGRRVHVGVYDSPDEAHAAWMTAAAAQFGEFASVNQDRGRVIGDGRPDGGP